MPSRELREPSDQPETNSDDQLPEALAQASLGTRTNWDTLFSGPNVLIVEHLIKDDVDNPVEVAKAIGQVVRSEGPKRVQAGEHELPIELANHTVRVLVCLDEEGNATELVEHVQLVEINNGKESAIDFDDDKSNKYFSGMGLAQILSANRMEVGRHGRALAVGLAYDLGVPATSYFTENEGDYLFLDPTINAAMLTVDKIEFFEKGKPIPASHKFLAGATRSLIDSETASIIKAIKGTEKVKLVFDYTTTSNMERYIKMASTLTGSVIASRDALSSFSPVIVTRPEHQKHVVINTEWIKTFLQRQGIKVLAFQDIGDYWNVLYEQHFSAAGPENS